jgi:methionyl-tRNA formyltransferase
MRIVFMGTPEFAVPSLLALVKAGHEVAAVFTQPDKPQGRKMILTPPPVKVAATEQQIPVFQPKTLKAPEEVARLTSLKPDAIVVAAYGKILPRTVLDIPKFGCINVHASLLPKYRGASPVQAAIMNGEAETGVTTMMMADGIDTGDILFEKSTPIGPDENTPELMSRLADLGAELLISTLQAVQNGTVKPQKQDDTKATHVSLITKDMSPIDWNRTAQEIHNQIRALYPWPAASASLNGHRLKIYRSRVRGKEFGEPGLIIPGGEGFLVCCGDGMTIELLEVQTEGGKKMSGSDFLRGHNAQGLKLS